MHYLITKDTLKQRLAKKVRALRKKLGLTLKAAAARAEMHWRHWQKVEAAAVNVTLLTLVRLGHALNIDPRELIAA
jgi:transcriptional regulator with XRE-family HTH domain